MNAVLQTEPDLGPAQRMDAAMTQRQSGIAPSTLAKLTRLFDETPQLDGVLLFGSRARAAIIGPSRTSTLPSKPHA